MPWPIELGIWFCSNRLGNDCNLMLHHSWSILGSHDFAVILIDLVVRSGQLSWISTERTNFEDHLFGAAFGAVDLLCDCWFSCRSENFDTIAVFHWSVGQPRDTPGDTLYVMGYPAYCGSHNTVHHLMTRWYVTITVGAVGIIIIFIFAMLIFSFSVEFNETSYLSTFTSSCSVALFRGICNLHRRSDTCIMRYSFSGHYLWIWLSS